jgi:putative membrane protein
VRPGRLLLAAGALAFAGCATRAPSPVKPRAAPTRGAVVPALTEVPRVASPAAYLARAASYDLLMTLAGELAEQRSSDSALRRTAAQLAAHHRGLAAQLSLAGRRLDLLPARTLLPNHQAWLEELSGAEAFDPAYKRLARRVHQNSYHMHAAFAVAGASPTLKLVARNAAATERRHWAELTR